MEVVVILSHPFHLRYLTGQQITSRGSVDAYITVLKKGCRCIERRLEDRMAIESVNHHISFSGLLGWKTRWAGDLSRLAGGHHVDQETQIQGCRFQCHPALRLLCHSVSLGLVHRESLQPWPTGVQSSVFSHQLICSVVKSFPISGKDGGPLEIHSWPVIVWWACGWSAEESAITRDASKQDSDQEQKDPCWCIWTRFEKCESIFMMISFHLITVDHGCSPTVHLQRLVRSGQLHGSRQVQRHWPGSDREQVLPNVIPVGDNRLGYLNWASFEAPPV